MAVSVGPTIKQLGEMAKSLGVDGQITGTGKDGKVKKEDIILPIRNHFLVQRYGSLSNIPQHMSMMLSLKSPMLAGRIDNLKPEQQQEVWESEEWDMEQKLNGVRCFIINDGSGLHMYSRHNSDVDLLPISFTEKILLPEKCDLSGLDTEFILDCEITSDNPNICTILAGTGVDTATQLQAVTSILGSDVERAIQIQKNNKVYLVFNSFDCIYYDKKWIMDEPLIERRKVAETVISTLEKCGFCVRRVPHTNVNKKQFFKGFVDAGLEGTVAKRLHGKYIADTTRNFNGWVKAKRSLKAAASDFSFESFDMSGMGSVDFGDDLLAGLSFGDTIDAYVTGFEPGNKGTAFEKMVGSVAVSVLVRKADGSLEEREIAKFSGITLDERRNMTVLVNGEPTLNPSYLYRVVEVDAQQVTKNGRFQHCTFVRWRWDKNKESCIIDESFLYKNLV